MKITSKSIITEVHVEISFQEFWDACEVIRQELLAKRTITCFLGKDVKELNLWLFSKENLTMEMVRDLFEHTYPLDMVKDSVIYYIGDQNGLRIVNYGYYDRFTKTHRATFKIEGDHI